MIFFLQSDVVLTTVCGENLLIAAGEARGKVPVVKGINTPGVYLWRLLEQGLDSAEISRRIMADYGVTAAEAEMALDRFVRELSDSGYIVGSEEA